MSHGIGGPVHGSNFPPVNYPSGWYMPLHHDVVPFRESILEVFVEFLIFLEH